MPTVCSNTQPISKSFNVKNTGIRGVNIDWKIFDRKDLESKESDLFTLDVSKNFSYDRVENPYKFNF